MKRLRETAGHNRELEVKRIITKVRATDILKHHRPEFASYFETQFALEPFPTLVAQMGRR